MKKLLLACSTLPLIGCASLSREPDCRKYPNHGICDLNLEELPTGARPEDVDLGKEMVVTYDKKATKKVAKVLETNDRDFLVEVFKNSTTLRSALKDRPSDFFGHFIVQVETLIPALLDKDVAFKQSLVTTVKQGDKKLIASLANYSTDVKRCPTRIHPAYYFNILFWPGFILDILTTRVITKDTDCIKNIVGKYTKLVDNRLKEVELLTFQRKVEYVQRKVEYLLPSALVQWDNAQSDLKILEKYYKYLSYKEKLFDQHQKRKNDCRYLGDYEKVEKCETKALFEWSREQSNLEKRFSRFFNIEEVEERYQRCGPYQTNPLNCWWMTNFLLISGS